MRKVTIKDVAERAGVSVTSVSRVLNNRGYLSDDMKKRVYKAIEDLNYTPNEIARSFYRKESRFIALIVPTVQNPFFAELTFHIEKELSKRNYNLFICNSMNDSDSERKYLELLSEGRVDGILVGSHNIDIEEYKSFNKRIVSIDRNIGENTPVISCDNYMGGKLASEELVKVGCTNTICFTGDKNVDTPANMRSDAYSNVMKENLLEYEIIEIPFSESFNSRKNKIKEILTSRPSLDGVFAGDDITAIAVMQVAKDLGLEVPKDLKVVGFDGTKNIRNMYPYLTTVLQPIKDIAIGSVDLLMDVISDKAVVGKTILPVELIPSKSTRK